MCVQINKTKTVSEYLGWDLYSITTNLQNFAIYQNWYNDYVNKLPTDYINAKHRKYWVEITTNQVIQNFDNNKREIAGTQYVWTKKNFPHQQYQYCTAETHTIKAKNANKKLKEWEVCPCNHCDHE